MMDLWIRSLGCQLVSKLVNLLCKLVKLLCHSIQLPLGHEFRWKLIDKFCWKISVDSSSLLRVRDRLEKLHSIVNSAFLQSVALVLDVPHHILGISDILEAGLI
jgi:hypothetical protein